MIWTAWELKTLRDEWDKTEVSVWSCCPTPTTRVGPTWVEVHATVVQEEEMFKKQDPTWEDIVRKQLPGGVEEQDWCREEGSQPAWWSPSLKMPP